MISLEELGMTKEELQDRVVERLCEELLNETIFDEFGDQDKRASTLRTKFDALIKQKIDAGLNAICEKHILPNAESHLENMVIQVTNSFGEKKGEPKTLMEYAVARCERWMMAEVDYKGEEKSNQSWNYKPEHSRLAWMIDKYLHSQIEKGIKEAMKDPIASIGKALGETAKIKLMEVAKNLKVNVETK